MALLAGAAALAILIFAFRVILRAEPSRLAGILRMAGAVVLTVLALAALATGRLMIAGTLASAAFALSGWTPGWRRGAPQSRPSSSGPVTREQALKILGLEEGATAEDIRAAHRRLMRQFHPDAGGSNELASQINQAKDVLLG